MVVQQKKMDLSIFRTGPFHLGAHEISFELVERHSARHKVSLAQVTAGLARYNVHA